MLTKSEFMTSTPEPSGGCPISVNYHHYRRTDQVQCHDIHIRNLRHGTIVRKETVHGGLVVYRHFYIDVVTGLKETERRKHTGKRCLQEYRDRKPTHTVITGKRPFQPTKPSLWTISHHPCSPTWTVRTCFCFLKVKHGNRRSRRQRSRTHKHVTPNGRAVGLNMFSLVHSLLARLLYYPE